MSTQPEIICIGEPMIELTEVIGADGRVSFQTGFGGDTANAAAAAARQGGSVGFVTALGADRFGKAFLKLWSDEGIDTSDVIENPDAPTGLYFVFPDPEARDFAYYRAGSAASRIRPTDIPEATIAGAKLLHVSGISQAISDTASSSISHAIDIANKAGVDVAYDTNLRLKLWPLDIANATIHSAMEKCQIALPSIDDSVLLTGLEDPEAIVDFYLSLGPSIVALKLGAAGCLVATRERREHIAAHPVEAVDSTGAGDAFAGAFHAEYLRTGDPFQAANIANVVAALTTTGMGAVAPIPTRQAVLDLLS